MDALSLSTNSFSSETSSIFSHSTHTSSTRSSPGASTPATDGSVLFDSRSTSPLNEPSNDFILVVGGLGYIGSHTSWELLKAGQNVIIVDNLSNSKRDVLDKLENLRDHQYNAGASRPIIDFYEADYRDQELLRPILTKYGNSLPYNAGSAASPNSKIAGVIHFAAYKAVGESFKKPLQYYANNVGGMIDFCATLSEFGIKTFIFSSSATVYGELANKGGRLVEEQCDNTGCAGLTNPYGRTKWMCEAILHDLAISDPAWTIIALRYFNPIGCDDSGMLGEEPSAVPSNLMPVVVQAMRGERSHLNVFGTDWDTPDGTAIRDFIHVSDLAAGHLAALKATERPEFGNGYHVYNLGTGTGHSVREIVNAMQDVSGQTIPVNESGRREGDVGVCIAEPSKSLVSLNWKTQKSLTQACQDICRYLRYEKIVAAFEQ